ncbi:MAG: hypothetical protein J1D88_07415 [Treponema sp.]|nr:hypothetical protein [Treponema sp.]
MTQIDCKDIELGVCYSAPVFFDDGINMFLAENRPAKPYHIAALSRWSVPFLLSDGHPLTEQEIAKLNIKANAHAAIKKSASDSLLNKKNINAEKGAKQSNVKELEEVPLEDFDFMED